MFRPTSPVSLLLAARGTRALADGFMALVLPVHLLRLGYGPIEVGVIATLTMLGSAVMNLAMGLWLGRGRSRGLLVALAGLMVATGLAFSAISDLWVLFLVGFVGTLNSSSSDVSAFRPLEQARIADLVDAPDRTSAFAMYSLVGTLCAAVGTLAAALPDRLDLPTWPMFVAYAALGGIAGVFYWLMPQPTSPPPSVSRTVLEPASRRPILTLAGLFSIDALGGGFVLQSMIALWFLERHALPIADSAPILMSMQLLAAASLLVAPVVARRIGLVNTMVFTHLPSNVFLVLVPLVPWLEAAIVLLLLRSALSSMDVAPRSALVMALVQPHERTAASSITDVPRSLAAAVAPTVAGVMLAASSFGWFLVVGGALKFGYDLALLQVGRRLARQRGLKDFN